MTAQISWLPRPADRRPGRTEGTVSHLLAVYDSSLLSYAAYQPLVGAAAEAPLS